MNFSQRSSQPELMDTEIVSYEQFRHCLHELEIINHWTLAYRPTLAWLKRIGRRQPLSTILDVGSGGGDMLRQIARHHKALASDIKIVGIDLNPWSKKAAEEWSSCMPLHFETGDVFDFEPEQQVDIIISSLFTHHLSDDQLVKFLRWMEEHANVGWFINDLHRHWLPYYFIKAMTHMLSRDRFIKHDAAISVSRAFTRDEWKRLLQRADIPLSHTNIRWHFPFRLCVERICVERTR